MAKKKLPEWATTVTPFSKLLALILFVTLPFLCFFLGMDYQQKLDKLKPTTTIYITQPQKFVSPQITPMPTPIDNHQFIFKATDSGNTVNVVSHP